MPKPAECFSELIDQPTQQAFVRFQNDDRYSFEIVSDKTRARQMHQWNQPSYISRKTIKYQASNQEWIS